MSSQRDEELKKSILQIIEHTTLEEHTAVELIMNLILLDRSQREIEARMDELYETLKYFPLASKHWAYKKINWRIDELEALKKENK